MKQSDATGKIILDGPSGFRLIITEAKNDPGPLYSYFDPETNNGFWIMANYRVVIQCGCDPINKPIWAHIGQRVTCPRCGKCLVVTTGEGGGINQ